MNKQPLTPEQKEANRIYQQEYRKRNLAKIKQKQKEYREANKEKVLASSKNYKKNNAETLKIKNKIYRENNPDKIKLWRKNNPDKIKESKKKSYEKNKEKHLERNRNFYQKNKAKINEQLKEKYKTNILFKVSVLSRNLIAKAIKRNGYSKKSKTIQILGCSFEEFKNHLELKFEPWMNWDNYGLYNGEPNYGWDIDHIIPLSSAKSEEELIKLNHFTNLQPLCSQINRNIKRAN
jgi:hypothetical protein